MSTAAERLHARAANLSEGIAEARRHHGTVLEAELTAKLDVVLEEIGALPAQRAVGIDGT